MLSAALRRKKLKSAIRLRLDGYFLRPLRRCVTWEKLHVTGRGSRCFYEVWTQQELGAELYRKTGVQVSRSTVQRVLSSEGLKPHRVRRWLHSPDPLLREKVARVCGLYLEPPVDSLVLCIDEIHTAACVMVNQVEVWFVILRRRVIRYGSFDDVAAVKTAVLGFIAHWKRGRSVGPSPAVSRTLMACVLPEGVCCADTHHRPPLLRAFPGYLHRLTDPASELLY